MDQTEEPTTAGPPIVTESTPLLASGSTAAPEIPVSGDERSTSQPSPVSLTLWGHWILLVDGVLVAVLAIAVASGSLYAGPPRYHLPWPIRDINGPLILVGLFTTIWAASNLLHYRRTRVLLSRTISAIFHVCLGVTSISGSLQGGDGLLRLSPCSVYGPDPGEEWWKCKEWAKKFHILVWIYLALTLLLGLVHLLMFILCCSSSWWGGPAWQRPVAAWRFPTGQLTLEFTIKFLRQDAPLDVERNQDSTTGRSS